MARTGAHGLPLILGGLRNATLQVIATATVAAFAREARASTTIQDQPR